MQTTTAERKLRVYISGPMSGGYPNHNFAAFEAAEKCLRDFGYEPVSPHRADANKPEAERERVPWPDYLRRDLKWIVECGGIALLDGWEHSKGARLEHLVAQHLGLHTIDLKTGAATGGSWHLPKSSLLEAHALVHGPRGVAYGHPREDFGRTAQMWEAILGVPIEAHQVAMCLIAVKLSRLRHRYSHDSVVDIAGYAECLSMLWDD